MRGSRGRSNANLHAGTMGHPARRTARHEPLDAGLATLDDADVSCEVDGRRRLRIRAAPRCARHRPAEASGRGLAALRTQPTGARVRRWAARRCCARGPASARGRAGSGPCLRKGSRCWPHRCCSGRAGAAPPCSGRARRTCPREWPRPWTTPGAPRAQRARRVIASARGSSSFGYASRTTQLRSKSPRSLLRSTFRSTLVPAKLFREVRSVVYLATCAYIGTMRPCRQRPPSSSPRNRTRFP